MANAFVCIATLLQKYKQTNCRGYAERRLRRRGASPASAAHVARYPLRSAQRARGSAAHRAGTSRGPRVRRPPPARPRSLPRREHTRDLGRVGGREAPVRVERDDEEARVARRGDAQSRPPRLQTGRSSPSRGSGRGTNSRRSGRGSSAPDAPGSSRPGSRRRTWGLSPMRSRPNLWRRLSSET